MFYQTLILSALVAQFSWAASKDCQLSLNEDFGEPQGLLLRPGEFDQQYDAFYQPDTEGILKFKAKERLTYECPGGYIKANNVSLNLKVANLTCESGKSFSLEGKKYNFKSISCTRNTKSTAWYTQEKCLKVYKEAEIGFELDSEMFINHITLCFDEELKNTLYTVFKLTKSISGYQPNYPRFDFLDAGFYDLDGYRIQDLYLREIQRYTINDLVGLDENSTKYIHATNDYYLARGHLTAKTDFIYGSQQRLTFYYINAAPQWQSINAGNWLALENSVRKFSSNQELDLVVYTGTHDILTLPHEDSEEEVEIYLYANEYDRAIPVPLLFWKVVYEPKTQKAIAFINLNNPYVEEPEEFVYCKDICDQIDWISWKADDIKSGFSYCCSVPDFRKAIKTLPEFKVTGVLK